MMQYASYMNTYNIQHTTTYPQITPKLKVFNVPIEGNKEE